MNEKKTLINLESIKNEKPRTELIDEALLKYRTNCKCLQTFYKNNSIF